MRRQQFRGNDSPHRVADDVGLLDFQVVHQPNHVLNKLRPVGFVLGRFVRLPVARHVDRDHLKVLGQQRGRAGQVPIDKPARQPAVNQHYRLAFATHRVRDLHALGVERAGRRRRSGLNERRIQPH